MIIFDFPRMIAPTCDDICLTSSVINSFSVLQVSYITWFPARTMILRDERSKRGIKIKKNDTTRIVYSPTSSVRTPTNRVVTTRRGTCRRRGHSTARISPMILVVRVSVARVSRDTRVSLPRRDWTPDLPWDYVYPKPRTRRITRPLLFASLLSQPAARASESGGGCTSFIPTARRAGRAVHPASTCRDATRTRGGWNLPRRGAPLSLAPTLPAGWLAAWLAD